MPAVGDRVLLRTIGSKLPYRCMLTACAPSHARPWSTMRCMRDIYSGIYRPSMDTISFLAVMLGSAHVPLFHRRQPTLRQCTRTIPCTAQHTVARTPPAVRRVRIRSYCRQVHMLKIECKYKYKYPPVRVCAHDIYIYIYMICHYVLCNTRHGTCLLPEAAKPPAVALNATAWYSLAQLCTACPPPLPHTCDYSRPLNIHSNMMFMHSTHTRTHAHTHAHAYAHTQARCSFSGARNAAAPVSQSSSPRTEATLLVRDMGEPRACLSIVRVKL